MNKIYIFFLLLLLSGTAAGQYNYQQITVDAGAGATAAFAGTYGTKTGADVYIGLGYYPLPELNLEGELQAGTLYGTTSAASIDRKTFTNNYLALEADLNIYLGIFFNYHNSAFLNAIKNFYGGAGFGYMSCKIANADLNTAGITDHLSNNLRIVPIKTGYEFNLLYDQYDEPLLKINLSVRLYYVADRGLDGYYDQFAKSWSYYTFYGAGVKYTFIAKGTGGHRYNKFD